MFLSLCIFRYYRIVVLDAINSRFVISCSTVNCQAMFAMKRSCKNLNLNVETSIYLFNTYVTPILNYGCETWGRGGGT